MGLRDRIVNERARSAQSALDGSEVYRRRLLEEVDFGELAELTESQRRVRLERIVGGMLTREGPVMTTSQRQALIRRVIDEAVGLGVLEPLLADETVTEIMVNGPREVWVERDGRIERAHAEFTSEAQLYQTIDRIVSQVNRRVDESSPMVDARLPSGERVNVIVPPLSLVGPVLTIRRFPRRFTLSELVESRTLDEPTRRLLTAFVRARLNIVISGGTGAGKTTLLNAMSAAILERERIVTIEEAAELQLQQPHVIPLEARPANVEGKGEVSIRDLVRNALRMRPDRIIVGEVRGVETLDMLQALNTGHEGSLGDRARQLRRRRAVPARDAGHDERPDRAPPCPARVHQQRDPRDRADRARPRRGPAGDRGGGGGLAPGRAVPAPERDAVRGRTDRARSPGQRGAAALRAPRADHAAIDALGGTGPAGLPERRARPRARAGGRVSIAAISTSSAALVLLLVTAVVLLWGLWLLASSSARRSELAGRTGIELRRRRPLHERLNARIVRTRRGGDLAGRLRSAGVERNTAQFLLIVAAIAGGTFVIVAALFPVLLAAIGAAVAWWACFAWLGHRLDKRGEEFIAQLPEVARLLSGGASAGLSIPAAIELTAREIEPPAREELQTVLHELSLGRPLAETLERLRRRLPSREIAVLMNTLIVQQRSGGDAVSALRELAETLDSRRETNREVRTLMAGAIYTAYIVPCLGLFSLVLLNTINSHTLPRMTSNPIGIAALIVAGTIYVVAFIFIRRVTRIEV